MCVLGPTAPKASPVLRQDSGKTYTILMPAQECNKHAGRHVCSFSGVGCAGVTVYAGSWKPNTASASSLEDTFTLASSGWHGGRKEGRADQGRGRAGRWVDQAWEEGWDQPLALWPDPNPTPEQPGVRLGCCDLQLRIGLGSPT